MSRSVLVVDDHESAAEGLAVPLRGRYAVTVARTVAGALAALAATAFSVVVLDLALDVDASPLHRELLLRETPVVVVSGIEADAARGMARVWRASALLKPVTDEELLSAVALAAARSNPPETPTMPDPTPAAPPEPALPPPAPAPIPSDAPLHPDPGVARADLLSRRILRGSVALIIALLTVYGDSTGHPVGGVTVAILGALGMGVEAVAAAAKKRPGVTAAGGAGLVLLALGGDVANVPEMGAVAAVGVSAATAMVDWARGAA